MPTPVSSRSGEGNPLKASPEPLEWVGDCLTTPGARIDYERMQEKLGGGEDGSARKHVFANGGDPLPGASWPEMR